MQLDLRTPITVSAGLLAAGLAAPLVAQPDTTSTEAGPALATLHEHACIAIDAPSPGPALAFDPTSADHDTIDILWAYTPLALAALGSEGAIQLACQQNIVDTNATFANAQLPFAVRTVGVVPVTYEESGDHLALLQGTSDGVMDEIHATRNALAADIVCLITAGGFCGAAYLAPTNPAWGFQKVTAGCITGSAFRHELGHNLGSMHWAHNTGGFFSYAAGHVLSLGDGSTLGTAMGGNDLQHFSNPRVDHLGVPTGEPLGTALAADNYLAFMQTAPLVARFRDSGDCDANNILDAFEIGLGLVADCDSNGVPDTCQADLNNNGTIDACEPLPVIVRVPEDFASIQLAAGLAESGVHEIAVGPGTWLGQVDTLGKAITIRSSGGPGVTTIDAYGQSSAVTIRLGEGPDTVVEGFTITGGSASDGAGMLIDNAGPTVRGCVFIDNHATYAGGGLRVTNGTPLIEDCVFESNTAQWGGAVSTWSGAPSFVRCLFESNDSVGGSGGAFSSWTSQTSFSECEFRRNTTTGSGGGLFIVDGGGAFRPTLDLVTFCENLPDDITPGAWTDLGGNAFLASCPACPADLNDDGILDNGDINMFIILFLASNPAADFNGDGITDNGDIGLFIDAFLAGC